MRWQSSSRSRASAASPSVWRMPCRLRSTASRTGPRPRRAGASCWCPSVPSRANRSRRKLPRMARYEDLPYRLCVGTMVLNRDGRVFVGRRFDGSEYIDAKYSWQMPQGGIDPGEDPYPAALRELAEETNIVSVNLLAEAPEWFTYDLPPH